MLRVNQIKLSPVKGEGHEELVKRLKKKTASYLGISIESILEFIIVRESIDARHKNDVLLIYTVDIKTDKENAILKNKKIKNAAKADREEFSPLVKASADIKEKRPVIVGFGPAGIFAAYILCLNGVRPIVLERGENVAKRQERVDAYWKGGTLNPESNVQFGEGGAGTFSDGKLNTQIKDPSHRIEFVLKTLVEFGASPDILYKQKPHVGTDVLKEVVTGLRQEIIRLGGEIRFETRLDDIIIENGAVTGAVTSDGTRIDTDTIILCIGHSARDTFRMLSQKNIHMEAKDFAVGYRVSHRQRDINISQYGEKYADFFEAAPYKLTAKAGDGRGVYSFCMCPGGYVVDASSVKGMLCVNGMSYSKRDSYRANSAIIVAVGQKDFYDALGRNADEVDPLIGLSFQEHIEKKTYELSGGVIPVQRLIDYKENIPTSPYKDEDITVKGRYAAANLRGIYPEYIEQAFLDGMEAFGRKIKGFDGDDTLIYASEVRTSSPVRINRDENGQSNIKGLFPCGEGAGYAGGITSAAVDGIKTAFSVLQSW